MNEPMTAVRLSRTFEAPREAVFRAWTDADELREWFSPEGFTTPEAEVDLRVGGRYRVAMRTPDGEVHRARGEYREVDAPARLVFTWAWEGGEHEGETVVTVEFHERDGGTEVVLTHERLAEPEDRERHREGWIGCLASLEAYLRRE